MSEKTQQPKLFDRIDVILAILAGVLSLALYVRTLAPGVLPGDSGEFQVLAYQLGVAHTTGYPVYILLARLFIFLVPVRDIAYRVNLFSAFTGALTVVGVYLGAQIVTKSRWAALFAALALTVSFTFWSQALIAEVYSAGAAFIIAVWVLLLVWYKTGSKWALFASGVCGGLGLGVHGSLVALAPAVGIFLLINWKRWKELGKPALLGALAGLILFFVVFLIVDLNAPPANVFNVIYGPARSAWGLSEAQVKSPISRMVFLASGRQWSGRMFVKPAKDMPEHFYEYVVKMPREFSPVALSLMLLGLILLFIRDWRLGVLFTTALLFHWGFYFNYRVGDIYVFYIPGYLLMAMLAAVGVSGIAWLIGKLPSQPARLIVQSVVMLVILYVSIAPVLSPYLGAVRNGQVPFTKVRGYLLDSNTETNYKLVAHTVRYLDQNVILLANWDQLYEYWYAAHIEQQRKDLRFVEMNPFHEPPGLPQSTLEFIRANIDAHPIYLWTSSPEVERAGFKLRSVYADFVRFYKVEKP
jgi:4-amino-4-deoxy-L-arabinose transferase-like glycosyltransferase